MSHLHEMVQLDLKKKGLLPITVSVPTNDNGSFNTSNKCMVRYSNGDKYVGSMVLTCLGWLKHGTGQTSDAARTFHIFGESKTEDKDERCQCITPSLTTEGVGFRSFYFRGYREYYFNSCERHASDDEDCFDRYFYDFMKVKVPAYLNDFMKVYDAMIPFPLHDCTPDEMKALRTKGLLLYDRFRLVKVTTEALYHEFIEPTADIIRQKDEKFFLNLRDLGEQLKLLRMKDETEEGVKAVMDEG